VENELVQSETRPTACVRSRVYELHAREGDSESPESHSDSVRVLLIVPGSAGRIGKKLDSEMTRASETRGCLYVNG